MSQVIFQYTKTQQINLSMAYLAYSGENLVRKSSVSTGIFNIIKESMPKIPPLCDDTGQVDWQVVWGPVTYTLPDAILQDNMMFVTQQISKPTNFIVAIRGTNGDAILDWLEEDFDVWEMVEWLVPEGKKFDGTPKISKATHTGCNALLTKMQPVDHLPGNGQTITEFLNTLVQSSQVNIQFTGHSLAGALAPTLALWFKQSQQIEDNWDPQGNAKISTIPFAGATAGNKDFSNYFNSELGEACDRIHNTLDIVPHAWETATLDKLPNLYASAGIKLKLSLKLLLEFVKNTVIGYEQIAQSNPFTWIIDPNYKTYMKQALHQHVSSYPTVLNVPSLLDKEVINRC